MSPELHQVVCEIRYSRGFKYFDKCGSVLLLMQDAMGQGFVGSVPHMKFGRLHSPSEQIDVRYSAQNFSVTQTLPKTAARVIGLAPRGWRAVAESLDVRRHVSRCGARFIWAWPKRESGEAIALLRATGFGVDAPATIVDLLPSFQRFNPQQVTHEGRDQAGRVARITCAAVGLIAPELPILADVDVDIPKFGMMLDMDFIFPGEGTDTSLSPDDLSEFLKQSWADASAAATRMKEQLDGSSVSPLPATDSNSGGS